MNLRLQQADRLVVAAALLGSGFFLAHLATFPYGRDQGIYAVVADAVLRGDMPYREAWDFKTPGIYFFYAAARWLFGSGMGAVRLLEVLGFASLIWAFAILSRRFVNSASAGVIAAGLAVLTQVQLEFWNTAQPSSFGAVVVAWALVLATSERRSWTGAAWIAAGFLYGTAALLKPPLGGGIAVSVAAVAYRRRQRAVAGGWGGALMVPAAYFGVGVFLPIALTVAYLWTGGALRDASWALFTFTPGYTLASWQGPSIASLLLDAVRGWATDFSAVLPVGLLLMVGFPVLSEREREAWCHVGGVIAVTLIGVALQAKFFPYHFATTLALTALLSGWGWWKVWIRVRQRLFGVIALAGVFSLLLGLRTATHGLPDSFWERCRQRAVAFFDPAVRTAIGDRLYSTIDFDREANRRVAEWIRAETPTDAKVFIWGFEPVIYDWAQRRPASRYIYDIPQRASWSREEARSQLMSDLAAAPPAVIVVQHADRFPWVTADDQDSAGALEAFPALQALLNAAYEPAARIACFDLYRRRRHPPPAVSADGESVPYQTGDPPAR